MINIILINKQNSYKINISYEINRIKNIDIEENKNKFINLTLFKYIIYFIKKTITTDLGILIITVPLNRYINVKVHICVVICDKMVSIIKTNISYIHKKISFSLNKGVQIVV